MYAHPGKPQINKNLAHARDARVGDAGFTLIELLVVILIIGILTAIAIPLFISQSGRADDAQAKALARTAATAMEAYATGNNGSYSGVVAPSDLQSIEPSINATSSADAELTTAFGTDAGYTIVATAPKTGDTFTILKNNNIEARSCSGSGGGCPTGTW